MPEELHSVADVAEMLKVNQQTVRNWIDRDELKATRVGARRVRVAESDLNHFLKLKEKATKAVTARPEASRRRRATASDVGVAGPRLSVHRE
jgi:excisionase family DNA binding protein